MGINWHNDKAAKLAHKLIKDHLDRMVTQMFPGHELTHIGINRNDVTEEVQLRLHLNPLGRVRVVPDAPSDSATLDYDPRL